MDSEGPPDTWVESRPETRGSRRRRCLPEWLARDIFHEPAGAFSAIKAEAESEEDALELEATFTLATDSNGIAPVREVVILEVGNFLAAIPAGSFRATGHDGARFSGVINGVRLKVIRPRRTREFLLTAELAGADWRR